MASNGSTAKRERAALALASGRSIRAAARETKTGERTLHRWLEEPAFRDRVQQIRTQLFDRAVGGLSRLAGKAAATLKALLNAADDRVKLQAAKIILETGMKTRETADVLRELAELKQQVEELKRVKGSKA